MRLQGSRQRQQGDNDLFDSESMNLGTDFSFKSNAPTMN